MSAILPGYSYDIFISYRQKDNKYDGWVTEFVDNLKRELEATFKEDISVYFDENPHDGLRETHIVDKSLQDKLKCLIFIPIISRTYVDPNSFAWHHEFIAFNKLAKEDPLGREVKLASGNYASRILPVKIHDIDAEDKNYLEKVLGGVLRPVEFIYRSAGVNRPLKPDDIRNENLNHTYYRDQINKVANAVRDIITGIQHFQGARHEDSFGDKPVEKSNLLYPVKKTKKGKKVTIGLLTLVMILILGIATYIYTKGKTDPSVLADKSIAVLPFDDMSPAHDQEYFSDGMVDEILNHLYKIGGLTIPSRSSTLKYKDSKLSLREIGKELKVSHVLQGSVKKSGNKFRISIQLIDVNNDQPLWSDQYDNVVTAVDILEFQSDVAQKVAEKLQVVINPEVRKRIKVISTRNTEAYNLYLQARALSGYQTAEIAILLEKAINLDTTFADAYAQLALYWAARGSYNGDLMQNESLIKALPLVSKALELDKNCIEAHNVLALINLWYKWNFEVVEKQFNEVKRLGPSLPEVMPVFIDYNMAIGNFKEALNLANASFKADPNSHWNWMELAIANYYNNRHEMAIDLINNALKIFKNNRLVETTAISLYVYVDSCEKAIKIYNESSLSKDSSGLVPFILSNMGIASYKTGNKIKADQIIHELIKKTEKSPVGSPSYYLASLYTAMNNKDKAIQYLQKAFTDHEVEMYWLMVEPLFKPLHGDPQFEEILEKIGFKRQKTTT
jgi:TolB-like protein/tetratricopeptide (TPR) repeat protein